MFLTKGEAIFRAIILMVVLALIASLIAFIVYYADISTLNAPKSYKGVFI